MNVKIEKELADLFARFQPGLPVGVAEEGLELVRHRECVVALELLGQMLFEHSVPLQPADLARIGKAATAMNLGRDAWDFLEPLVERR